MTFTRTGTTLGIALALSACTTTGFPADPTGGLAGQEWVVEDISGRGVVDNSRTTLEFGRDGRLTGDTACNRYSASYQRNGAALSVGPAATTKRACPPVILDQERRFLTTLGAVNGVRLDGTGALILSTATRGMITARTATVGEETAYRCTDGRLVTATYPTADSARVRIGDETVPMTVATSASGARYVGGGWQWWTKGRTVGLLSPRAQGEDIASATGVSCVAR